MPAKYNIVLHAMRNDRIPEYIDILGTGLVIARPVSIRKETGPNA